MRIMLLLAFLGSCAINQVQHQEALAPNKNLWMGRSSDEVMLHLEFAVRQMISRKSTNGTEIMTFKNSGGVQSSGGCRFYNGISSCSSDSGEIVCNHLFLIKNSKVADYFRTGDCGEEQLQFRPRVAEGNPVFTANEKMQFSAKRTFTSQTECSVVAKIKHWTAFES